jgi:hypothetical protein
MTKRMTSFTVWTEATNVSLSHVRESQREEKKPLILCNDNPVGSSDLRSQFIANYLSFVNYDGNLGRPTKIFTLPSQHSTRECVLFKNDFNIKIFLQTGLYETHTNQHLKTIFVL